MADRYRGIIIAKFHHKIICLIMAPHLFMAKVIRPVHIAILVRAGHVITPPAISCQVMTRKNCFRAFHPVWSVINCPHRPAPARRGPVAFTFISRADQAAPANMRCHPASTSFKPMSPHIICCHNPIICHNLPSTAIKTPAFSDFSNICFISSQL